MIFTTSKAMNEREKVLHDDMVVAILERVLERGPFFHLDGPSGRTRHLKSEDSLHARTERLGTSGTHKSHSCALASWPNTPSPSPV